MGVEREKALKRIGDIRDLAWRSRRLAGTVPTQWMIDRLTEYADELEATASELESRLEAGEPCPSD